jgi:trans-2,3-dihydro-3-hydroxyanthranilate isomerase
MPMLRRAVLFFPLAVLGAQRPLPYEVWDVFSDRTLTGNQLAVFPDARGLDAETMLKITKEMNYSESTFVFPREAAVERQSGVETRIFLRTEEVPFAGHPTLGTAFALWTRNPKRTDASGRRVRLALKAGMIPVDFTKSSEGQWEGVMTQPEPVFAELHEAARIAPLIGVPSQAIDGEYPIQNVSTGRPNLLVMLKSLAALRGANFNWPAIDAYFAGGDRQRGFYLLCRETRVPGRDFHTRKIGRGFEDPVTGSAAGSAIAWLVKLGRVAPGKVVVFEQGTEIAREGTAKVSAEIRDGCVTNVKVGGSSVKSMSGVLYSR